MACEHSLPSRLRLWFPRTYCRGHRWTRPPMVAGSAGDVRAVVPGGQSGRGCEHGGPRPNALDFSGDGLSISTSRRIAQTALGFDLWVSERLAIDLPWEAPVNLGPTVNSPANDNGPSVSPDGRYLFFVSTRPGEARARRSLRIATDSLGQRLRLNTPVPLSSSEHDMDRRRAELLCERARSAPAVTSQAPDSAGQRISM